MFDLLGPLSSQAPSVQNPLSLVSLETLLGFVVFRPGSFSASRGRFGRDGGGFRELSRACAGTVNLPPALFHYRNPLSINPPSTLAFLSSQLPPFALSYRRRLCCGGAARLLLPRWSPSPFRRTESAWLQVLVQHWTARNEGVDC
jgi:hypothetical protein